MGWWMNIHAQSTRIRNADALFVRVWSRCARSRAPLLLAGGAAGPKIDEKNLKYRDPALERITEQGQDRNKNRERGSPLWRNPRAGRKTNRKFFIRSRSAHFRAMADWVSLALAKLNIICESILKFPSSTYNPLAAVITLSLEL